MIFKCLECGHEQIGYSCIDGKRCEKCKGVISPTKIIDDNVNDKFTKPIMLGDCYSCSYVEICKYKLEMDKLKNFLFPYNNMRNFADITVKCKYFRCSILDE